MDNYISIIAALVSFAVTASMGIPLIPYLKKLKYGQTILDEGPNWHKSKEGTPTMGGVMIAGGVIIGLAVALAVSAIFGGSITDKIAGGFTIIDRRFGGKLNEIITEINQYLYDDGGITA